MSRCSCDAASVQAAIARPKKPDHCTCGHVWNTFDTGGVCPGCLYQWTVTACLSCDRWSAHSEWYEY